MHADNFIKIREYKGLSSVKPKFAWKCYEYIIEANLQYITQDKCGTKMNKKECK